MVRPRLNIAFDLVPVYSDPIGQQLTPKRSRTLSTINLCESVRRFAVYVNQWIPRVYALFLCIPAPVATPPQAPTSPKA